MVEKCHGEAAQADRTSVALDPLGKAAWITMPEIRQPE
jgi:hypothetical protein